MKIEVGKYHLRLNCRSSFSIGLEAAIHYNPGYTTGPKAECRLQLILFIFEAELFVRPKRIF